MNETKKLLFEPDLEYRQVAVMHLSEMIGRGFFKELPQSQEKASDLLHALANDQAYEPDSTSEESY